MLNLQPPTDAQVVVFVEKAFGHAQQTGSGETLHSNVICPICSEKQVNNTKYKLAIRLHDHLVKCWVCGYKSTNLLHLLEKYKPHLVPEYRDKFKFKAKERYQKCVVLDLEHLFETTKELPVENLVQLPLGFTLMATNIDQGNKAVEGAWRYLKSRGLTFGDLWLWKFGVTEYKAPKGTSDYRFRVILPSFDVQGNPNYFSARAWWSKFKGNKYANPKIPREDVVFNEMSINWDKELTVVEGVFDLVKCNENATCLLGSSMNDSYLLFKQIVKHNTPVLLALDNDANHKSFKLAKLFLEYGIKVRLLSVPSSLNDVGQMTKAQFLLAREQAKPFTTEDFLRYKLENL